MFSFLFSFFFLGVSFFFNFLLIPKFILKKKSQNDIVLAQLTAGHNWSLTEYRIDNN